MWSIPPALGFVDALADGLLAETGGDPLALAEITVLVPTRRAGRSLREAFLRRAQGKPLLLPRLMPLQDIDEDEALLSGFGGNDTTPLDIAPPIAPLSRQILLTRLILSQAEASEQHQSPEQAARLAQELARLLDQVQTERLSFENLADLVPDTLAEHWQLTLNFLQVVTQHWPNLLEERGTVDPAEHRNQVFAAQARAWRQAPPQGLIVAAGSTGTIPATRDLLSVVAALPNGCLVLPGLDQRLEDEAWAVLEESHPQYTLKALLDHFETTRDTVSAWPVEALSANAEQRQRLITEVMRPAETSERWQSLEGLERSAVDGIQRIEAPTPREEAAAIAMVLRWVVEEDGRTGALVTPDRALARRVSAELERWELTVDDSAGQPLTETPPGVFLRLTAAMAMDQLAPIPLLATLKHPLAAGGMAPPTFRDMVRDLEVSILRGPRPSEGLAGLRNALAGHDDHDPALDGWLATLHSGMATYESIMAGGATSLSTILRAHVEWAETLAASKDTAGPLRLWAGPAGESLARFIAELDEAAPDLGDIHPMAYPGLLDALLSGQVVRPPYGTHPRLSILGPLEARLLRPDVLVLSGLNEGTWPANTDSDPWMSRPMRKAFGLPQPERRVGQAAHDIAQGLGAPDVFLTRSLKVEGNPTVASRWWRRFDQVLDAAKIPALSETGRYAWLPWSAALTRPEKIEAWSAPAPRPPVDTRPRRLRVTEVETWMRDPYEIYARHVLKLRALDPIDADAGSADYGTIVHDILQDFVRAYPNSLPKNLENILQELAEKTFGRADLAPGILAFWAPRFERIANWFAEQEREGRGDIQKAHAEVSGTITLSGPASAFELSARADRIDELKDGSLSIIDYKTGAVPSTKEVAAGYAPQLPLEAVIAAEGGFSGIPAKDVSNLAYWRLTGRGDGGEVRTAGDSAAELRTDALAGLTTLIKIFDDPATPYEARPHPDMAPRFGDTQHLARVKEWAAAEGGE
ncbi:MAG: double-strand break repair protein AddB [Alphaproteobacteria bacterium]|nr:double-strand break repair protein AddB [Alphaproteobacteria bacterium]